MKSFCVSPLEALHRGYPRSTLSRITIYSHSYIPNDLSFHFSLSRSLKKQINKQTKKRN